MTKAEQAHRLAWRFKVLQQACEQSRNVARACCVQAPLSMRVWPRSFRIVFGSVFASVMTEKNGLIISSHVIRPRYTVRLGSGLNLFDEELLKCASTYSLLPLGAKIGFVGL